jgi:hypothetical protein
MDGPAVAFVGAGSGGQSGIYTRLVPPYPVLSTDPVRIADTTTPIPGASASFSLYPTDPSRLQNQQLAFIGTGPSGLAGIYLYPTDPHTSAPFRLVDTTTLIPTTTQPFGEFSAVSFSGTQAAFVGGFFSGVLGGGDGTGSNPSTIFGVYRTPLSYSEAPSLTPVADTNTPVPGGVGNFTSFGVVVMDGSGLVFEGFSSDGAGGTRSGLYTDVGGGLTKVIATGDLVNGKTLAALGFGPNGFDNGQLVFSATYGDGSQAIGKAGLSTALSFAGFLSPLGGADATGGTVADPLRAFKLGSTIPVKMIVTSAGVPVTGGAPTLQLAKLTSATTSDAAIDATPTDAATAGNQFRLTYATTGEWHFNIDTSRLSKGTWQINATLADGSVHVAIIELK